jgi:hypothetical protein
MGRTDPGRAAVKPVCGLSPHYSARFKDGQSGYACAVPGVCMMDSSWP